MMTPVHTTARATRVEKGSRQRLPVVRVMRRRRRLPLLAFAVLCLVHCRHALAWTAQQHNARIPKCAALSAPSSYYSCCRQQRILLRAVSFKDSSDGGGDGDDEPNNINDNDRSKQHKNQRLEDDIGQRLSISSSRNRAISALSKPVGGGGGGNETDDGLSRKSGNNSDTILPPAGGSSDQQPPVGGRSSRAKPPRRTRKVKDNTMRSYKGPADDSEKGVAGKRNKKPPQRRQATLSSTKPNSSYSSLLPPPLGGDKGKDTDDDDEDDPLSSGLSSWEEFLGASSVEPSSPVSTTAENEKLDSNQRRQARRKNGGRNDNLNDSQQRLPSIQDLFPPDLSATTTSTSSGGQNQKPSDTPSSRSKRRRSQPLLDGVLPVSDLFYRSSQQQSSQEDDGDEGDHDDEELPFSAEQSDSVSSDDNKLRIRRNMVQQKQSRTSVKKIGSSRKMVRRGMEMLVGGVPINADPPQRAVELYYDQSSIDWGPTISLSTRDFGPLLHAASTAQVSQVEKGLFCEYFCHSAMKWDVCPKDLRQIVKSYSLQQFQSRGTAASTGNRPVRVDDGVLASKAVDAVDDDGKKEEQSASVESKIQIDKPSVSLADSDDSTSNVRKEEQPPESDTSPATNSRQSRPKAKGFGKERESKQPKAPQEKTVGSGFFSGELRFEIGVSKQELESGEGGSNGSILKSMLIRALGSALKDDLDGFRIEFRTLKLTDLDDGTTLVEGAFHLLTTDRFTGPDLLRRTKQVDAAFMQAIDDGDLQVAMAAATKVDRRWPKEVRSRLIEELLLGDDEDDGGATDETERTDDYTSQQASCDVDLGEDSASPLHMRDDIFRGGGTDGVFYDYSEANALNSPYGGEIGLRLVDAVTERAKQRSPRVIAIGDVHGCIDELQDLLRECDYQPGDLVVFLGDLVCKGPDSISVVQMAREIGAIGVRGNHDFEVIRWHQAIKSGVDPPVVGSEHFHIASCLSKADMKWMYSLPWYISSKELGALFVHAGFVSGIRLAKQNPRLMMNMRSILPDGTVTSKFFNNWPWARLWDGPQTVLFGHDADRGLQQYEHAIGLDTGCVYGGRLTACILPEKRLVSVSARREYFKYRRRHYD